MPPTCTALLLVGDDESDTLFFFEAEGVLVRDLVGDFVRVGVLLLERPPSLEDVGVDVTRGVTERVGVSAPVLLRATERWGSYNNNVYELNIVAPVLYIHTYTCM